MKSRILLLILAIVFVSKNYSQVSLDISDANFEHQNKLDFTIGNGLSFNFNDKILIKKGKKVITKKIKLTNPPHGPLIRKVVKIFLDSIKKNKNYIDYKSLELTKFQNKIY